MATANDYAQWIIDNQDKRGTEEFNIVAQAYTEAKQQEAGGGKTAGMTAEPSLQEPLTELGAVAAARPTAEIAGTVARNLGKLTPGQVAYGMTHPIETTRAAVQGAVDVMAPRAPAAPPMPQGQDMIRAVEPNPQMTFRQMLQPQNLGRGMMALGRGAAGLLMGPETIMAAPYMMAGYEMEKMRANPQAYPNAPYAQTLMAQAPTVGAAGAANVRRAIGETPSSYVPSPAEAENILASGDERMIRIYGGRDALTEMIRRKAAEKVLSR